MIVRSVRSFRAYFEELNRGLHANQISADVIEVAGENAFLDPVTEVAEVQRMINSHNMSFMDPELNRTRSRYKALDIGRHLVYSGYLIPHDQSVQMVNRLLDPAPLPSNDLKYMASNILIATRPVAAGIRGKVGGIDKKVTWRVTHTGVFDNRVWAARLEPLPPTEDCFIDRGLQPLTVLAFRKGSNPADAQKIRNWRRVSPDKAMLINTFVGERVFLRIEVD